MNPPIFARSSCALTTRRPLKLTQSTTPMIGNPMRVIKWLKPSAVSDSHHEKDLVRAWGIGHRHRYRVEVREGPGIVLVPERHIEARTGRGDLHVRRDYRLAAADHGPHRLAERRVDASTAMLHLTVDAYDRALAVRDGWPVQQLDELGHQPLAEHRPRLEQWSQIIDEPSSEGIDDHCHADCAHNRPRRCDPSSERTISRVVMNLRISTIAPSLFGPQRLLYPSRHDCLVDVVHLVDLFSESMRKNFRKFS